MPEKTPSPGQLPDREKTKPSTISIGIVWKLILGLVTCASLVVGYLTWSASKSGLGVYIKEQTTIADIREIGETASIQLDGDAFTEAVATRLDIVRVHIHNRGGKPIKSNHVIKPISISALGNDSLIYGVGRTRSNPKGISANIRTTPPKAIAIDFGLLNPGDIIEIPVIGSFHENEQFSVTCRIENITEPRVLDLRTAERQWEPTSAIEWTLILFIFAMTWIGFKLPAGRLVFQQDFLKENELVRMCKDAIAIDKESGADTASPQCSSAIMLHQLLSDRESGPAKWREHRNGLLARMQEGSLTPDGVLSDYAKFLAIEYRNLQFGLAVLYTITFAGWVYIAYLIYT